MAGHSKWSKDKHLKVVLDKKHGKNHSRLSMDITLAAGMGEGDDFPTLCRGGIELDVCAGIRNGKGKNVIKSGLEELTTGPDPYLISFAHDQLFALAEAVQCAGVSAESQKLTFVPEISEQLIEEPVVTQVIRDCEALEYSGNVLNIYSNFDIPGELLTEISA